jgi:hypothetical protein
MSPQKLFFVITYLLEDEQELSLGMLDTSQTYLLPPSRFNLRGLKSNAVLQKSPFLIQNVSNRSDSSRLLEISVFFASGRPRAAARRRGSPTAQLPRHPQLPPPPLLRRLPSESPSAVVRSSNANANARAPPRRPHMFRVDAGGPPRRPHLFGIDAGRPHSHPGLPSTIMRHPGLPSTIRRRPDSAVGNDLNSKD